MTLEQIVDKKLSCGGGQNADTGKLGCQIEWGTPLHVIGMTKGTIIPKETEFNKAYIDSQIQLGKFFPLIGAEQFDRESSEDSVTTNSRNVERINVLGLPKYKFTYEEGHEFYREMSKLTSFKALDFIFADEEGNWKMAVTSTGDYKGFSAGQAIALLTMEKTQGGASESKAFSIQLIDRQQWDYNYAFALRSSLDFSPEEIDGVNRVTISYKQVPSATDTTIIVNVALKSDGLTPVEGLLVDDFIYTVNGVSEAITTVVESPTIPGEYTLTVAAVTLAEVVGVGTFDATVNKYVVLSNGTLYRGEIVTETVVA